MGYIKGLVILALIAMTGACARSQSLLVYNGCNGSYIKVKDGGGQLLISNLEFGNDDSIQLSSGRNGGTIQLFAEGFEPGTDRPLGTASTTRSIRGGSTSTSPTYDLEPWKITSLQTTDPKGGCKR